MSTKTQPSAAPEPTCACESPKRGNLGRCLNCFLPSPCLECGKRVGHEEGCQIGCDEMANVVMRIQPSAADLRAATLINGLAGRPETYKMAEIISREMEPERRELLDVAEKALAYFEACLKTDPSATNVYQTHAIQLRAAIAHAKGKPA